MFRAPMAAVLLLILFVFLPVRLASAQSNNEGLAACAAIADSLERLRCYDDLAQKVGAGRITKAPDDALESTDPTEVGTDSSNDAGEVPEELTGWQIEETKSPIDDSLSVFVSRVATEPYRNQFGGQELAFLHIRCVENATDVLISTDAFLGLRDSVKVTVRLDSKQAVDQWWSPSTSARAAFAPQPIKFVRELLGAEKLTIRLYPRSEADITAQFDLSGLSDVVGRVQAACNWQ